jgi:hypothetical protein
VIHEDILLFTFKYFGILCGLKEWSKGLHQILQTRDYVLSWRPSPSSTICTTWDPSQIRWTVKKAMEAGSAAWWPSPATTILYEGATQNE